jgi:hypothetical protein
MMTPFTLSDETFFFGLGFTAGLYVAVVVWFLLAIH